MPGGVRVVSTKGPQQPTDEQLGQYIREIGKCNNVIVQRLSNIVDEKQIAKYLYYLDHREALAEPPKLAVNTGIGSVLRKQDIEYVCNERIPPLIDPLDDN